MFPWALALHGGVGIGRGGEAEEQTLLGGSRLHLGEDLRVLVMLVPDEKFKKEKLLERTL